MQMLGIDVVQTEKTASLGSQGDILLADFSQYIVGLQKEITLDRSAHVGFTSDLMTWRAIVRADGAGGWTAAYTPKTGSTLSWAVTLAERT